MRNLLYPHQLEILDKIVESQKTGIKGWGIFLEPGLGKTRLALSIANKFIDMDIISDVILVIPVNLEETWKHEIKQIHYAKYLNICHYSKIQVMKVRNNPETVEILKKIKENTLVILDESHYIKNRSSKRSKILVSLLKKQNPYILSLSGTPETVNILDFYNQCVILKAWSGDAPLTYTQFSDLYSEQYNTGLYKIFKSEKNRDLLMSGFKDKAFFVKKDDVLDLPDKIYDTKYYCLSRDQKKAIMQFKTEAMATFEPTQQFVKKTLYNMLAVCSGFMKADYNEDGVETDDIKFFNKNPKLDLFKEIISNISGKVIVYCIRHTELEMISKVLDSLEIKHVLRHGKLSADEKELAINQFKNSNEIQCMVATVQSTYDGLNLQDTCDQIIYFSNTYSLLHREQSEGRIHRVGQTKRCHYIDLVCENSPDDRLLSKLRMKKVGVDDMFHLFKSIYN